MSEADPAITGVEERLNIGVVARWISSGGGGEVGRGGGMPLETFFGGMNEGGGMLGGGGSIIVGGRVLSIGGGESMGAVERGKICPDSSACTESIDGRLSMGVGREGV